MPRAWLPTLEAAFKAGGVHLVTVPIDYSENIRVLVDELRNRVPARRRLAQARVEDDLTMRTRAAVLGAIGASAPYATSKPLRIEELELDPPGPGEVLVRIRAAGLCHSDLSVINGDRPRPVPMALGHEAAGVVEELGPGVEDLARGDHVVCVFVPSCGHCEPCAEGRPALCEPGAAANGAGTLLAGARRLHRPDGTVVNHHLGVSGFAEHATVSRRSLVKIDKELPLEEAALFGCAVLTGVGAVANTARIPVGSSVAVIGLGGVGLCSLLGAIAAGAREVVAIDLADDKLAFARQLGRHRDLQRQGPRLRRPGAQRHAGRGRVRVRACGLDQGAGARLPDHPPRRHHGDRRPAAAHRHHAAGPGEPRGRGAHAQGQLYRHRRAEPGHPALHRAL